MFLSCHPATGRDLGLALNEAMASGRPVIAGSRVGGARDLIEPDCGWIFPSGDLDALTAVLRTPLSLGREGLAARGRAAQVRSETWSTEAAATGIEQAVVAEVRKRRSP